MHISQSCSGSRGCGPISSSPLMSNRNAQALLAKVKVYFCSPNFQESPLFLFQLQNQANHIFNFLNCAFYLFEGGFTTVNGGFTTVTLVLSFFFKKNYFGCIFEKS
jgi:hypothetical protein